MLASGVSCETPSPPFSVCGLFITRPQVELKQSERAGAEAVAAAEAKAREASAMRLELERGRGEAERMREVTAASDETHRRRSVVVSSPLPQDDERLSVEKKELTVV